MVNTVPPENAVMNLKFPDLPSPNRKAVTNTVHKEVLSDTFLLEWSETCQDMLSQKQVRDWTRCLEVLHSKQVCLYHQHEMQHNRICVLIRQLVHKLYSTDHEVRLNFLKCYLHRMYTGEIDSSVILVMTQLCFMILDIQILRIQL